MTTPTERPRLLSSASVAANGTESWGVMVRQPRR